MSAPPPPLTVARIALAVALGLCLFALGAGVLYGLASLVSAASETDPEPVPYVVPSDPYE